MPGHEWPSRTVLPELTRPLPVSGFAMRLFLGHFAPMEFLPFSHSPFLVAMSFVVALVAAFTSNTHGYYCGVCWALSHDGTVLVDTVSVHQVG